MTACLGEDLANLIGDSKVLVVGTGGIGCELLKNLVLSGFKDIVAIDLDTIDVSNLNRQFLFQKRHVGRSKVEVARETALTFNPSVTIQALHDSITSPKYNVNFFKQYTLVMNALDNKAARSHVNRLCLAADVPLIESGSAGYQGQVTVIRKGHSECYECTPPPATKTFPGCTIRNTPSQPIHCIVWAKHLFSQLFGEPDADNDVSPEMEEEQAEQENMEAENGVNGGKSSNGVEGDQIKSSSSRISTRDWAERNGYSPTKLFHKLFHEDIQYLLSMEKLWQERTPPTPLDLSSLSPETETGNNSATSVSEAGSALPDQQLWSPKQCADIFLISVPALKERFKTESELIWDKDDNVSLEFVAAAANLRATNYSIPLKSKFDVKSMAGNIIPAIATTNAVIAGLIVMEALKVVAGDYSSCKMTFLPKYPNHQKKLLVSVSLPLPNPSCYVCSPKPEATVKLNCNSVTLGTVQDKILKGYFDMLAPDVELDDGKGTILISSEEGETTDNLPKRLREFGVGDGSRLKCDDFQQNFQLVLQLVHCDEALEDEKDFVVLSAVEMNQEKERELENSRKRRAPSDVEATTESKKIHTMPSNALLEV